MHVFAACLDDVFMVFFWGFHLFLGIIIVFESEVVLLPCFLMSYHGCLFCFLLGGFCWFTVKVTLYTLYPLAPHRELVLPFWAVSLDFVL